MAGSEFWQLTAYWLSGKAWQFDVSPASTIGELRRLIMLASGSMQKIPLLVESESLEGENEPLTHFAEQGLDHGAQLTVVVSEVLDSIAARLLPDAELTGFIHQVSGADSLQLQSLSLGGC